MKPNHTFWWYDGSDKDLVDKVAGAARRYRAKFAENPNCCAVNPSALDGGGAKVGEIKVVDKPTVLRNHFELWREEEEGDEEDEQGQETSADGSCPLVPVRDTVSGEQLALNGCGFWEPTHPTLDDTFEGGCYA